ncbi:hypothetical protein B0H11DRAFT_2184259 [Mycena galericulata]|nr:hypothetical protein B0H11DRAFT_2184259 [Mycena galericulata]
MSATKVQESMRLMGKASFRAGRRISLVERPTPVVLRLVSGARGRGTRSLLVGFEWVGAVFEDPPQLPGGYYLTLLSGVLGLLRPVSAVEPARYLTEWGWRIVFKDPPRPPDTTS